MYKYFLPLGYIYLSAILKSKLGHKFITNYNFDIILFNLVGTDLSNFKLKRTKSYFAIIFNHVFFISSDSYFFTRIIVMDRYIWKIKYNTVFNSYKFWFRYIKPGTLLAGPESQFSQIFYWKIKPVFDHYKTMSSLKLSYPCQLPKQWWLFRAELYE